MGRRGLRMIEECYQVYYKKLGYQEPFESWDAWRRDGKRYKVNLTTWWGGFWMGGYEGFGYLNVPGYGLYDEGWGNPVPHEFGHVVQGHQGGFLNGGHWESHANFLRQSWQMHFAELFPVGQQSQLDLQVYELSNLRQDHGKLIYRDFRIHQALKDYADDFGLDPHTVGKLWTVGEKDNTVYNKLAQALPAGVVPGDVVAFGLRHWPFLDFSDGNLFKQQIWANANDKAWHDYLTGALLVSCPDKPGWWRVPLERAPERFGYMYHELKPSTTTITAELRGFDLAGATEDWRWSLAAVTSSGQVRFSDVWTPGTHTFTLAASETKVYLIVVATPTDNALNLEYADNRFRRIEHPDRLRYAYEVRLEGAAPATRQLNWTTTSGHTHSNGGGWVANTASVASTAYVGAFARVLGTARLYNNVRVEDYAVIADNATLRDNAVVSGYAVVRNNAQVRNNAKVRDRSVIQDSCLIEGNAVVEDYAHLTGSTNLKDTAIARGVAMPWEGVISGAAILDYDYSMAESVADGVHFSHIPWGGWYKDFFVTSKTKPRGLVASYRIEEPQGDICWDEFGTQHALLRGQPQRPVDPVLNSPVLRLNGSSQYLVLDRSVADLAAATLALWCKPAATLSRPLVSLGNTGQRYLLLELDAQGKARFTIVSGATTQQLVSTSGIAANTWTHLAVTLSGSQGTLYVNGVAEATGAVTLTPDDVMGANNYASAESYYVGRDGSGVLYQGDLEDIRFYNTALTPAEVQNEIRRNGDCIGAFYCDMARDFDGSTTAAESGVLNGPERVLQASILPDTSDDIDFYEAILDSTDERDGAYEGSGFGLDNGEILVRLDNAGFWRTGVKVTLGQWQKITVAFNGRNAALYLNDQLKAERTYTANTGETAGKNYRHRLCRQHRLHPLLFPTARSKTSISMTVTIWATTPPRHPIRPPSPSRRPPRAKPPSP